MAEDPRPANAPELDPADPTTWPFVNAERQADYAHRGKVASEARRANESRFNRIALARLLVVLGGAALAVGAAAFGIWASLGVVAVAAVCFHRLTIVHDRVHNAMRRADALAKVNEGELARMQGRLDGCPTGEAFADPHHPYCDDLDLFGARALFPRINRAGTSFGRRRLASWLLDSAPQDVVLDRQTAARELAADIDFLQNLQAETLELADTDQDPDRIRDWLTAHPVDSVSLPPRLLLTAATLVILVTIGMAAGMHIPIMIPLVLVAAGWFASAASRAMAEASMAETRGLAAILERYAGALAVIEAADCKSPLLTASKSRLGDAATPSAAIPQLKAILDCLEVRNNPVMHFPLNLVGFWDMHALHRLQSWRREFADSAPAWLEVIAEFEAVASFATLAANHPDWAFPAFLPKDAPAILEADALGHPLIPETTCVRNNLSLKSGQVLLITGSNMAGKSTFMRAVGVAVVLARAGAPVCAKTFRLRPATPWTSMRTRDSLVDSESTFYAELRRLKQIIQAVERKPADNLFILDEVLRGTNSRDRHLGADALLRQLVAAGGSGMLATHDLQLASLADDHPENVQLVCFESTLDNNQLSFDYTIRPGVCANLNASFLMRNMGINVDQ